MFPYIPSEAWCLLCSIQSLEWLWVQHCTTPDIIVLLFVWLFQLAWLPACCGFEGPREGGLLCRSALFWSVGRAQRIHQARRAENEFRDRGRWREGRTSWKGGYRRSGLSLAAVMWLVGAAAWRNDSSQSRAPPSHNWAPPPLPTGNGFIWLQLHW